MAEKSDSGEKKLYRSGINRMIGGVCGGVAEYFNIDVTLVRIIWVILALVHGLGVLLYLAFLILVHDNPAHQDLPESQKRHPHNAGLIIGIVLIIFGVFFLLRESFFWHFHWAFFPFWSFPFAMFFPILIILFGIFYVIYVLTRSANEKIQVNQTDTSQPQIKKLFRLKSDKMISGVCSGLAKYWKIDVALIRVGWVIATIMTGFWIGILAYIVCIIAIPEEEDISKTEEPKPTKKKSQV